MSEIKNNSLNFNDVLIYLGKYQNYIYKQNGTWRKYYFNWENATEKCVELREYTNWYYWLYPISFTTTLACILEALQHNINDIFIDREETFSRICIDLKIKKENMNEYISKIQELLINYEKVKVCKDGRVVIMNDVW